MSSSSSSSAILQNCKLTYFNIAARGEATRLALSIGGIKFKDERIAFPEWKDLKQTTPWGSLPLLTLENGQTIAQQRSMLRFIGKHVNGLYPLDDHMKAAHIDSVMDAMEDVVIKLSAQGQGLKQSEKEEARAKSIAPEGVIYNLLMNVENFVKRYGGSSSKEDNEKGSYYAIGDSLTIADLFVFANCGAIVSGLYDGVPSDALDKGDFPTLYKIRKTVRSQSAVMEWYNKLDSNIQMPTSYGPFAE